LGEEAVPVDEPSKFQVLRSSTLDGFFESVYFEALANSPGERAYQYHSLGADAIVTIDPDVFSHNIAILREIKIFFQLEARGPCQHTLPEQG